MRMIRDPEKLGRTKYEVLVVGGGIYGACIARDAALRGLKVALIEKDDFGAATSANSLKIIHGGLRYLQDANLKRVRTMIAERSAWLRTAPHLVRPLPCLVPSYPGLKNHKLVLAAGLVISDLVGFDRNRDLGPEHRLPNSRTMPRADYAAMLGEDVFPDVTGGAAWYDARVLDTERLLLALLHSSVEHGAEIANYVSALEWLSGSDGAVRGVRALDERTGQSLEIQADLVVNSTGAWTDRLLRGGPAGSVAPRFNRSLALNLVVRKLPVRQAVGLPVRGAGGPGQTLFVVPWAAHTVIGTKHLPWEGSVDLAKAPCEAVDHFLAEINSAFQKTRLSREDVIEVQWGFLPAVPNAEPVRLVRESRIHDHEIEDGIAGLVSVVGVKYTTARLTGANVVDLLFKKLGKPQIPSKTDETPVWGGEITDYEQFFQEARNEMQPALDRDTADRLIQNYGTQYRQVFNYAAADPGLAGRVDAALPVTRAEIVHAVRDEMAVRLADVVRRRVGAGLLVRSRPAALAACLEVMAGEMGWDADRVGQELQDYHREAARYSA